MFTDKEIVATGCSHTYGDFLNQHRENREECHSRSWVKKLEKIAGFVGSSNLAFGGSSNMRSFRVIKEYVLNNLDNVHNKVVMIGLTEPIRFELPSQESAIINDDLTFTGTYTLNMIGPWQINGGLNLDVQTFINTYYGRFTVLEHTMNNLMLELVSMHTFLKSFDIEHYFLCMLVSKGSMIRPPIPLPIIDFDGLPAIEYAKRKGFKVGKDLDPSIICNHLDHDGNEFLAHYIYERIKEMKNV